MLTYMHAIHLYRMSTDTLHVNMNKSHMNISMLYINITQLLLDMN